MSIPCQDTANLVAAADPVVRAMDVAFLKEQVAVYAVGDVDAMHGDTPAAR